MQFRGRGEPFLVKNQVAIYAVQFLGKSSELLESLYISGLLIIEHDTTDFEKILKILYFKLNIFKNT